MKYLPLLFTLLFSFGCATKPTIRADWDKEADFASYKTFRFAPKMSTNREQPHDTLLTKYLKTAVRRELESRGYTEGGDDAALEMNFHLFLEDKQEVRTTASPTYGYYGYRSGFYNTWGGYRYDTYVNEYTQGTLHIDMVDNAADQLVWEGVAVGEVTANARENPEEGVNNIVKRIFEKYPFNAGQGAN